MIENRMNRLGSALGARMRGQHVTMFEAVKNAILRFIAWRRRACTRRALAKLDADLLRDVGLTCEVAAHEASKPFWVD